MSKLFTKTTTIASVLLLSACASKAISPEAALVQVHEQVSNLLSDCKKLGAVSGYGSKPFGNALPPNGAIREAIAELRESTHMKSGDSVAIVNTEVSLTNVRVLGIAYRCFDN
jgi:hypothetical protein